LVSLSQFWYEIAAPPARQTRYIRKSMKTPGQRGAFGEWLTRARTRRFATQAEALREYERLAGLRITPSQYAQWESGSRVPRTDNPKVARLYDFYGSRPEDEQQETAQPLGDQAVIVAALDRQTVVFERLAAALEQFVSQGQAPAQQPLSLEAQREVAEAERDLARRRDSEQRRRPARRPDGGGGSSAFPMPHE
jgi:transcriptional regulator with XRE-family HTH domain